MKEQKEQSKAWMEEEKRNEGKNGGNDGMKEERSNQK